MSARAVVLMVATGVAVAAIWLVLAPRQPATSPAPVRQPLRMATTPAAPVPGYPPSITSPAEVGRATVVVPWEPATTPAPTATEPAEPPPVASEPRPTRDRVPSPTPAVDQCLGLGYSESYSPGVLGQVLVDVEVENRCGRDLQALDVWFEVTGYRKGDVVQATRGHLLDALARGDRGRAVIALPGSVDWYDRIGVRVASPRLP